MGHVQPYSPAAERLGANSDDRAMAARPRRVTWKAVRAARTKSPRRRCPPGSGQGRRRAPWFRSPDLAPVAHRQPTDAKQAWGVAVGVDRTPARDTPGSGVDAIGDRGRNYRTSGDASGFSRHPRTALATRPEVSSGRDAAPAQAGRRAPETGRWHRPAPLPDRRHWCATGAPMRT